MGFGAPEVFVKMGGVTEGGGGTEGNVGGGLGVKKLVEEACLHSTPVPDPIQTSPKGQQP